MTKHLKARALTSLDNNRPQWLADGHTILDVAVAAVYGWNARISEDEALKTNLAFDQMETPLSKVSS